MVYQDRLETYLLQLVAVSTPRNFRIVFYNCCYFWGQHCRWTETSSIGNDFLFFKDFIASTLLLPHALPLFRHPWKWGQKYSLWFAR